MKVVTDSHYQDPRLVKLYDIDSPWSADRDFYLALARQPNQAILDLGCGTGLLCNAYAAQGHDVTGVDPSAAMLEIGRQKSEGRAVEWVQSFAQDYSSDKLFDLIIMTGHAFQAVLNDADIDATFAAMRKHLKPTGRVVFESRNPAIDWAKVWDYDMALETSDGIVHESRRFTGMNNGRMTFDLLYRFADETLVSHSELRFLSCSDIKARMEKAGLQILQVLGDWDSSPFTEGSSPEMIFIASPS